MRGSHRIEKSGRMKGWAVDGVPFVHLSLPTGLGDGVGNQGLLLSSISRSPQLGRLGCNQGLLSNHEEKPEESAMERNEHGSY